MSPKYSSGEEMLGLGCFGGGTSSRCEIGKSKIYLPFLKLFTTLKNNYLTKYQLQKLLQNAIE
jgi:hypothetical protein